MANAPTFFDVAAAAARIAGHAHRTPVVTSRSADAETGVRVFFKCENLQRMGAFKFRGAFNALSCFDADQRKRGVVAFSSGNHAQAIALAARLLGMPAVIVMPADAPPAKLAATEGYGGEVIRYDRFTQDRSAIAREIARERGMTLIPPFDNPHIIAGQGTAAKELLEETGPLDALFVPLGGGGLLAGSALAAHALAPGCAVYGVEPEAGDDGQRSFRRGEIVTIDVPRTIADGAQTTALGELTFGVIRRHVRDVHTASDAELVQAMRFFAERLKMVVEPTGCLAWAAARRLAPGFAGKRVGVILSGGNVDLAAYARMLAATDAPLAGRSPPRLSS